MGRNRSLSSRLKYWTAVAVLLAVAGFFGGPRAITIVEKHYGEKFGIAVVEGAKANDDLDALNASAPRLAELARQNGIDPSVTAVAQVKLSQMVTEKSEFAKQKLQYVAQAAGDNVPVSLASTLNVRRTLDTQADELIRLAVTGERGPAPSESPSKVLPTSFEKGPADEPAEERIAAEPESNVRFVSLSKPGTKVQAPSSETEGFHFRVGK